jgi:hypothetical protein
VERGEKQVFLSFGDKKGNKKNVLSNMFDLMMESAQPRSAHESG